MISPVTYESKGSGPDAIVFLHGIGGDAQSFAPQLDALSRTRRAVAWNMPGYGGSEPAASLSFAALADALEELLDRLNIARADLFGHSIGGMVALEFAATRPDRVRSLILCATTPAFGSKDGSFEQEFLKARLGPLDAGKTMKDVAAAAMPAMVGEGADPAGVALAQKAMSAVPACLSRGDQVSRHLRSPCIAWRHCCAHARHRRRARSQCAGPHHGENGRENAERTLCRNYRRGPSAAL
jgi:3-oxoadipate enol-lactonase